ncbi:MAG: hypothetical protein AAFU03_13735, partial [Bacteroidota bacterium]
MLLYRYFSFLLVLLFSVNQLSGQAELPANYLDDLEEFMSASRNKNAEEAFSNFYGLFLSGAFTPEEQLRIAQTTSLMQERRVRSQKGFISYFHALEQIKNAENGEEQFVQWHMVINNLLAEVPFKLNRFSLFLVLSDVFIHQKILDNSQGGTDWFVLGGTVSWEYDTDPILKIDDVDRLSAFSAGDSILIQETNLRIDMIKGEATGTGGKVDWQRVGLSEEIYAELISYNFITNRNVLNAPKARMRYPEYFGDRMLAGSLTDRTIAGGVKSTSEFPQFTSEDGYLEIKNVGEGIDLRGNFEIRGNTVYAIGDKGRRAEVELTVFDAGGSEKVRGRAERFSIVQQDRVIGNSVETTIYFGADSLYHPSVSIKVDVPGRIVQLIRTKSGADQNPFYHSLNRVNIYADYLDIYLDQDSVLVGKPTVSFADKGVVRVESEEFFSKRDYYRIKNIAEANPLALMLSLREQEVG